MGLWGVRKSWALPRFGSAWESLGVPEPLAVDPNWLLSTTAQSAAALVAIIGGFLVSRLVSLSSDKHALERRLAELQGRYHIVRSGLQQVYEARHATSVEWLEDIALATIVERSGDIDVNEVVDEFTPRGAERVEMREAAADLISAVQRVLRIVKDAGASTDLGLVGKTHERLDERDKRILREINQRSPGLSFLAGPPPAGRDSEIGRQDRRIEQEEELGAAARVLEAEAEVVKVQLRSLATPPRMKLAVFVLVYFALVSIVYPLWCMTQRPVPDDHGLRVRVVLLLISGLGALLYYLVTSIGGLKWADPEAAAEQSTDAAASRPRRWKPKKRSS